MPRRIARVQRADPLTPAALLVGLIEHNGYTGKDAVTVTFNSPTWAISYRVKPAVAADVRRLRRRVDDHELIELVRHKFDV